jgi:hypothetical protein
MKVYCLAVVEMTRWQAGFDELMMMWQNATC